MTKRRNTTRDTRERSWKKPSVFIGSSSEGLRIAKQLQLGLAHAVKSRIWTQGVFGLSQGTLESLEEATKKADFAILVLTPDDLATKRGKQNNIPRDNVVFELGLFMGALGRARTFIVHNRDEPVELPSDLAGVTTATFSLDEEDDLQVALGEVCTLIEDTIDHRRETEDQEPPGPMADLLGTWKCTWLVNDGQKNPSYSIKDRIVFTKLFGENIFGTGSNPKYGAYALIGRVTPTGVLTFYYRGDAKRHFTGGVVIMKLQTESRTEMSGVWHEYDADRQFYGGKTIWKKVKVTSPG